MKKIEETDNQAECGEREGKVEQTTATDIGLERDGVLLELAEDFCGFLVGLAGSSREWRSRRSRSGD